MTMTTMSFEAFARLAGLTMESFYRGTSKPRGWDNEAHTWEVVFSTPGGRTWATSYHMGLGHKCPAVTPKIGEVLNCLASDASADEARNFEEWASDMGMDTDSRRAEATYNACCEAAQHLRDLLGDELYRKLVYDCSEDGDD